MKTPLSAWSTAVLGQAIEGASDGALISLFGSAGLQAATSAPPIDLKHVASVMATASIYYVCSYLKKFPTPESLPAVPAP